MQHIANSFGGCITDSAGMSGKASLLVLWKQYMGRIQGGEHGNYTGFRTANESYSEVDMSWINENVQQKKVSFSLIFWSETVAPSVYPCDNFGISYFI